MCVQWADLLKYSSGRMVRNRWNGPRQSSYAQIYRLARKMWETCQRTRFTLKWIKSNLHTSRRWNSNFLNKSPTGGTRGTETVNLNVKKTNKSFMIHESSCRQSPSGWHCGQGGSSGGVSNVGRWMKKEKEKWTGDAYRLTGGFVQQRGSFSSSGKSPRCPPGDDADGHHPSLIRSVKVCGWSVDRSFLNWAAGEQLATKKNGNGRD